MYRVEKWRKMSENKKKLTEKMIRFEISFTPFIEKIYQKYKKINYETIIFFCNK